MKAIVQTGYGSPDFFELREVARPAIKDDEVLVRVRAAALHAGDYFFMRGVPYMVRLNAGWPRPRNYIPGYDVAGHIEAIGNNVATLQPGEEVFGACTGSCAEYARVKANSVSPKPANLTLEQAAAVPTSAVTALRGLRDVGKVQPGQKVLINGASGGVGTFAVQIARALGAEVTAVCSTLNVEMVRLLGADHVIDYTREDFTQGEQRYDLILDQVANHPLSDCRGVLTSGGMHIPNSGHSGMSYIFKAVMQSLFVRQQRRPYLAIADDRDLADLTGLIEAGKLTPVVDRTYPLNEIREAFRYLNEGHARGKVVIII